MLVVVVKSGLMTPYLHCSLDFKLGTSFLNCYCIIGFATKPYLGL